MTSDVYTINQNYGHCKWGLMVQEQLWLVEPRAQGRGVNCHSGFFVWIAYCKQSSGCPWGEGRWKDI